MKMSLNSQMVRTPVSENKRPRFEPQVTLTARDFSLVKKALGVLSLK